MPYVRHLIGLLAAVSILATGAILVTTPAMAQEDRKVATPVIVRITTPATAGTYTVDWQTLGGCDPGSGTSGMSGEVTLTVAAAGSPDDTPEPGELTGTPAAAVVVIRPFCDYVWHVSFVEATTGANCIVGPAPFGPDDRNEIQITLDDPATSCAQRSRIVVRLHPTLALSVDETDHNAILRSRFIATARRTEDAPRRCSTRTAVSKLDDNGTPDDTTDDSVSLELRVVATTAAGEDCHYDVTLRVPRRLVSTLGSQGHSIFENIQPPATIDFSVGVATKTIYLLQNVTGDSGGANARYELDKTCSEPDESDIPPPLLPLPAGDGIQSDPSTTFVELSEGRFNITAALADDPSAPDAFDGIDLRVLDNAGEACEAAVSVYDLPDRCVAEESTLTVNLPIAPEPTILEFEITCGDDVAAATNGETDDGDDEAESANDNDPNADGSTEDGGEDNSGDAR